MQVQSLVQEDLTCRRAIKPERCNYWSSALAPRSCNCRACVLHLVHPARPRACASQEKPLLRGSPCTAMKSNPCSPQLEKTCMQQRRPSTVKNKYNFKIPAHYINRNFKLEWIERSQSEKAHLCSGSSQCFPSVEVQQTGPMCGRREAWHTDFSKIPGSEREEGQQWKRSRC